MSESDAPVVHLYKQRHDVLCGTSLYGDTSTLIAGEVTCPQCQHALDERAAEIEARLRRAAEIEARTPRELLNAREMFLAIGELMMMPAQRVPAAEAAFLRLRATRVADIARDLLAELDKLGELSFNDHLDNDYYLLAPRPIPPESVPPSGNPRPAKHGLG